MTSRSRDPNDLRSFLSGPGLRILLGIGAGYVSRRLWTHTHDSLEAKLAQLDVAPTIPIWLINEHRLSGEGKLVLLQDAEVRPLERHRESCCRLYTKESGKQVVALKTVEYSDQIKGYPRHESVSVVPFGLWESLHSRLKNGMRNGKLLVVVKNVDLDHLPLEHKTSVAPLDPSADWSTRRVMTKVINESYLRVGQRLENVFGRLSVRDGIAEIQPCSMFPKKCFTMSRSEIKREIEAEARVDAFPTRACSFGVGLVSLGLLFSGLYTYV